MPSIQRRNVAEGDRAVRKAGGRTIRDAVANEPRVLRHHRWIDGGVPEKEGAGSDELVRRVCQRKLTATPFLLQVVFRFKGGIVQRLGGLRRQHGHADARDHAQGACSHRGGGQRQDQIFQNDILRPLCNNPIFWISIDISML